MKIEKRISQRVSSYYSYKLRLLHELRDTKLSYLSKDKKDKKIGYIAVCIKAWSIKVCNKYLF